MRLQDDIDFTTLSWVKEELDETLKQARQALESYVEDTSDTSQMRFCATYLHQVQGTLRMVELYGAALVVEEMEQVALSLLEDRIADREEAYETLMRGIVQLPDYLERLQSGHRDIPVVLLPLLNDLRASRGEKLLSETALFSPDLTGELPASAAGPTENLADRQLRIAAAKIRKLFEAGLVQWFKTPDHMGPVEHLLKLCDKLRQITSSEEARRLWWVAGGVLDGLRTGALEPSGALKLLIGKMDRQIKGLALKGEAFFETESTTELTSGLLYYAAHAGPGSDRIEELKQVFRLTSMMPDAAELEHARGAMAGHNRELLSTVSGAIKEDLMRVKDSFDLKVRQNNLSNEGFDEQGETLDRVADTLGMLGLGVPRKVVMEQREKITDMVEGRAAVDEAILLDLAGSLLYVEASLDDHIEALGTASSESTDTEGPDETPDLPKSEVRRILEALMVEASSNLQVIKQNIVEFIEAPWDHERVAQTPGLLEEIVGALRMLDMQEAADLLRGVIAYTEVELLRRKQVPQADDLDTMADAIASIEYYLEAVREHRPGREKILEVARQSLDKLGYLGEDAIAERLIEAESEIEPAAEAEAEQDSAADQSELREAAIEDAAPAMEAEAPESTDAQPAVQRSAEPADISDDIDEEIREVFIEEVEEELEVLNSLYPRWRADTSETESLTTLRRTFHTLKGSGRLVGAHTIGEFSWQIENLLNRILDGTVEAGPQVLELMDAAVAAVPGLLANVKGEGRPDADIEGIKQVAEQLAEGKQASLAELPVAEPVVEPAEAESAEAGFEPVQPVEEASEPSLPMAVEAPEFDSLEVDVQLSDAEAAALAEAAEEAESDELDEELLSEDAELALSPEVADELADLDLDSIELPDAQPEAEVEENLALSDDAAAMLAGDPVAESGEQTDDLADFELLLDDETEQLLADAEAGDADQLVEPDDEISLADALEQELDDQADAYGTAAIDSEADLAETTAEPAGDSDLDLDLDFDLESLDETPAEASLAADAEASSSSDLDLDLDFDLEPLEEATESPAAGAPDETLELDLSDLDLDSDAQEPAQAADTPIEEAAHPQADDEPLPALDMDFEPEAEAAEAQSEAEDDSADEDGAEKTFEFDTSELQLLPLDDEPAAPGDDAPATFHVTDDATAEMRLDHRDAADVTRPAEDQSEESAASASTDDAAEAIEADDGVAATESEAQDIDELLGLEDFDEAGEAASGETSEALPDLSLDDALAELEKPAELPRIEGEMSLEDDFGDELSVDEYLAEGARELQADSELEAADKSEDDYDLVAFLDEVAASDEDAPAEHDTLEAPGDTTLEAAVEDEALPAEELAADQIGQSFAELEEAAAQALDSPVAEDHSAEHEALDESIPATEDDSEEALPEAVEDEADQDVAADHAALDEEHRLVDIDPVLREILRTEVSAHLEVVRGYLDDYEQASRPLAVTEPLMRAVHTLNGAVSMVDLPALAAVTGPLEGYVKRLNRGDGIPSEAGLQAISDSADLLRTVVDELERPDFEPPATDSLSERLLNLRDDLPEPETPRGLLEPGFSGDLDDTDLALPEFDGDSDDALAVDEFDQLLEDLEPESEAQSKAQAEETGAEETQDEAGETEALAADESQSPDDDDLMDLEDALAVLQEASPLDQVSDDAPDGQAEDQPAADLEDELAALDEQLGLSADADLEESAESLLTAEDDLDGDFEGSPDDAEPAADLDQLDAESQEREAVDEAETEPETEPEPEAEAETQWEAETDTQAEAEAEPEFDPQPEPEAEAETEAQADEAAEAQADEQQAEADAAHEPAAEDTAAEAIAELASDLEAWEESAEQYSDVVVPEEDSIPMEALGDVDDELLEIFLQEGAEILDESDHKMAEWRQSPENNDPVTELQRELHTLKGGARMAGLTPIGDLSHAMESLFESVVEDKVQVQPQTIEVLESAFDRLHQMLDKVGARAAIPTGRASIMQIEALLEGKPLPQPAAVSEPEPERDEAEHDEAELEEAESEALASDEETAGAGQASSDEAPPESAAMEAEAEFEAPQESSSPEPEPEPEPAPAAARPTALDQQEQRGAVPVRPQQELIRVRADLLDNLVNYAGEVSIYRSRLEQQIGTFRFNLVEFDQTVQRLREQLRKLEIETEAQILSRYQREAEELNETFDPLELDRFSTLQQLSRALAESVSDLVSIQSMLDDLTRQSETLLLQQSRVNSDLQEGLMRTRMVPFDSLVPRLRRILRQTAGELSKKAQLRVQGAQGEMDRTVLERITAPLEHMLRNAVAHGLESPEVREAADKPAEGTITVQVSREATEVVITVSDDGAGIEHEKVRRKAIERGMLREDAELTDRDLYGFILETGFSTVDEVTKVAGRGVGMDVVNSEIKQLGGSLDISSEQGQGTTFTIRLPFTLAVTHAIMVRVADNTFAVPLTSIQGVVRMPVDEFDRRMQAGETTYTYTGDEYQLKELAVLLGLEHREHLDDEMVPVLMSRIGDQRAAIRVDAVLGSREIVVKSVGPQISSIPGIFGATILGDGSVIMILDVGPLIRRGAALQLRADAGEKIDLAAPAEAEARQPLIMVVDDSITMRKVTTRVLHRHDMEVVTAKDGVDAVEQLQERIPDLMLLDIEMPRMDGFEVATHMRNDERLKDIPIIMITSRTGEKHRERALEIGVNRYLGKPYQEAELLSNVSELLAEFMD